jgi:hypothetical protein
MTPLEMMSWIRGKMDSAEEEIRYLEEILTSTNGPANDIVDSLHAQKRLYNEFQTEYNRYYDMYKEEKAND